MLRLLRLSLLLTAAFVFCTVARGAAAQKLKVDVPLNELQARAVRDSNDAVAHYNLALGYWSKRRWEEADASLQRAAALDPRFAPADLAIAYLPLASGKGGKIEWLPAGGGWWWVRFVAHDTVISRFDRHYRRAFMLDPLVDIRIAVASEYRDTENADLYDRALYSYNDGNWEEAYRRFGELVADSAKYRSWARAIYERILWYHSLAALRLKKPADAVRDLGWLVEWSKHREQSDTMFRFSLRTNEYRYALGFAKQQAGDLNGAVETYQEALTEDVGLFPAHLRIAEIYEGVRQWEPAINARRNAVNANPDDASLQSDLGWTLAKAGRFADAEAALRDAVERAPRDARAAYYLGIVQQQLGRAVEAKTTLQRFIQIAPSRYERQVADARQRLSSLQ